MNTETVINQLILRLWAAHHGAYGLFFLQKNCSKAWWLSQPPETTATNRNFD